MPTFAGNEPQSLHVVSHRESTQAVSFFHRGDRVLSEVYLVNGLKWLPKTCRTPTTRASSAKE